MKFKDLITKYTWPEIYAALLQLYPDQTESLEGYHHVYDTLLCLPAQPTPLTIIIERSIDDVTGTPYDTVSGRDETSSYGIEFTNWSEWLGMDIDAGTLAAYTELDVIAHCLWEMTFFGYTQAAIQQQLADFQQQAMSGERVTLDEVKRVIEGE